MRGRRGLVGDPEPSVTDDALGQLDAHDLRELIRELLLEVDDGARGRVVDRLVARAARKGSGWAPEGPNEDTVAEITAFVAAAKREHWADPRTVDAYLRRGSDAFLGKDYAAARRIFHALLPPIAEFEIDLGQHEMVDDVLNVDVGQCASQYVVSLYMTSAAEDRAEAVQAAIRGVGDLGVFRKPIQEMEGVAVEPLPDLDDFLPLWRALVENTSPDEGRRAGLFSDEERWLREVVERTEGANGLAGLARSSRHGEDLQAWCGALVESREWKAALSAFEESAEIVRDGVHWRGGFLDGAGLAAQELGRKDLPVRLERAWRESPSLLRLRRWLGSGHTKARVRQLAEGTLEVCPKWAECQRAVLHVVLGDHESAAERLEVAPGLGWSDPEHPGHLLVLLFHGLLVGRPVDAQSAGPGLAVRGLELEELEWRSTDPKEPHLRAAKLAEILETAGVQGPLRGIARIAVLAAMRKAAEKRVAGVTKKQRRRHYEHAAQLVAMCAELDPTPATGRWVEGLRSKYSRYPALQRELNDYLGKA